MDIQVLIEILRSRFGAQKEGARLVIAAEREVSVLLRTSAGVMSIPKVRGVEPAETYVALSTQEDTLCVEAEHLFGVRGREGASDDSPRAGFLT